LTIVAVVPVKPLRRGKSRLATVLNDEERYRLNCYLFTHTLKVLEQVPEVERILVVSRDTAALAVAREHGAHTLQEPSDSQLNLALKRTTVLLRTSAVSTVVILPADLPLLTVEDVQALLQALPDPQGLVLAPNVQETGTNGLAVRPPDIVEYRYGPNSFENHLAYAREARLPVAIVRRPGLQYDVDWPEDLHLVADVFPEFAARVGAQPTSAGGARPSQLVSEGTYDC